MKSFISIFLKLAIVKNFEINTEEGKMNVRRVLLSIL